MNRSEAKALGLKRYFNGNPCINGHIDERLTSNGQCIVCARDKSNKAYNADIEASRAKRRAYMASRDSNKVNLDKRLRRARRDRDYRKRKFYLALDSFKARRSISKGQISYLSSRPCKNNHIDTNGYCLRSSSDGKCRLCFSRKIRKVTEHEIAKSIKKSRKKRDARLRMFAAFNRSHSLDIGLKFYRSKNKCKYGHISKRYTSNGTCRQCVLKGYDYKSKRSYDLAYREKNKDRLNSEQRRRYRKNRNKYIEAGKEWARNNKDKVYAIKNNYKHKRRTIERDGISTRDFKRFVDSSDKICFYCDTPCESDFHVDHITPLSKGGEHQEYNLCIACPTCNVRKSSLDPEEFIDRLFSGYYDDY